jgi:DnaK suppressor protein
MTMPAKDLVRLKEKLLALKTKILSDGDLEIQPVRGDEDEIQPDQDAQPLTEMSQVIASKRNSARTAELARIVSALDRIEKSSDDFGMCNDCGDPIGRRLEAMPYVELCVECQQEQDGSPKLGRRRHITDYK